jgi:RNA polymerase-interacting CarD/CdnL/TRCF family regulator
VFHIGERVVHPHHGVGTVTNLVDKRFESDSSRRYYEISIADGTLWVPVDEPGLGLRGLSLKSELDKCGRILQSSPSAIELDFRRLREEFGKRLKDGTIVAQCEVVRDVTALGWKKPLVGAMADLRRMALSVLCQEWESLRKCRLRRRRIGSTPTSEASRATTASQDSQARLPGPGTGKRKFHLATTASPDRNRTARAGAGRNARLDRSWAKNGICQMSQIGTDPAIIRRRPCALRWQPGRCLPGACGRAELVIAKQLTDRTGCGYNRAGGEGVE